MSRRRLLARRFHALAETVRLSRRFSRSAVLDPALATERKIGARAEAPCYLGQSQNFGGGFELRRIFPGRAGVVLALLAGWAGINLGAGEVVPSRAQSAPGRFEVAAVDPSAAQAVASMAEVAWRHLERPLALPAEFSSPVFVRLLPAEKGAPGIDPFEVITEAGGVVSVWWKGDAAAVPGALRRALVRGLLSRLSVATRGGAHAPTVPAWLEHACVAWWETRADLAQLDAMKYRAARMPPPPLAELLDWPGGTEMPPDSVAAAMWLMTFLQAESGKGGEWPTLLRRLLAGMDPQAAVAESYPGRFFGVPVRELWWQTGWHHARRVRTLPVMEAAESREALGVLARFVFAAPDLENDFVAPLGIVVARRHEPMVAAELARRAAALGHLIPALHPFYRNAGLSLAEVWSLAPTDVRQVAARCAVFEQDWRDGQELEAATKAALDAFEQRTGAARSRPTG